MKFSTCLTKITSSRSEAELRSSFMENAGELVGAKAWGLDLLDNRLQVVESDLHGLPDSFCDRYREIGRDADWMSQRMIQERVPVHNLSMQTPLMWQQSKLYQHLFQGYGIAHGMVAPLVGNSGLIGGIYFMRGDNFAPFCDADLIRISTLCQHLSVRLATLQLPWIASRSANMDCLTHREMEIVELVAQGLSNREIAIKIDISRDGVKQALKRIFRKLNVSARTEMIAKLNIR
jgi:DNA-binding CsgD family transcriptional regulator